MGVVLSSDKNAEVIKYPMIRESKKEKYLTVIVSAEAKLANLPNIPFIFGCSFQMRCATPQL